MWQKVFGPLFLADSVILCRPTMNEVWRIWDRVIDSLHTSHCSANRHEKPANFEANAQIFLIESEYFIALIFFVCHSESLCSQQSQYLIADGNAIKTCYDKTFTVSTIFQGRNVSFVRVQTIYYSGSNFYLMCHCVLPLFFLVLYCGCSPQTEQCWVAWWKIS